MYISQWRMQEFKRGGSSLWRNCVSGLCRGVFICNNSCSEASFGHFYMLYHPFLRLDLLLQT